VLICIIEIPSLANLYGSLLFKLGGVVDQVLGNYEYSRPRKVISSQLIFVPALEKHSLIYYRSSSDKLEVYTKVGRHRHP